MAIHCSRCVEEGSGRDRRRRGVFQEGHLDRHVRQNARVLHIHADTDLDGRLLAIGSWHDGDDGARDAPVRIGIEHGFDAGAGMQTTDRGFVDVNLDLDRAHVDDGADAGAGEAAAGRQRRDHLAGLRAALDHDAGEGGADLVLGEHLAGALRLEPRRCQLGLRLAELGPQHAGSRLRFGQIGLGRIILTRQRLGSIEDSLGIGQIGGNRGHGRVGGFGARLRQRVVLVREHIVEPGENLAGLYHHALVDQEFDDLARDLGRDRGLAARHHVAGRDQAARAGRRRRGWMLLLCDLGGRDLGSRRLRVP